jgi:O-antigen/teichoic acid export membrane protein
MSQINQLFQGIGLLMSSNMWALAVRFTVQLVIVRFMTLEEFGIYSTSLAVVTIFEGAANARAGEIWLNRMPSLLNGITNWPPRTKEIFIKIWREEVFWTSLAFAMVQVAGLYYALFVNRQAGYTIVGLGFSMIGLWCFGAWKSILIVSGHLKSLGVFEMLSNLVTLISMVTGVILFGFWGAIIGFVTASILRNLIFLRGVNVVLKNRTRGEFVLAEEDPGKAQHIHSFIGSGLYSLFNNFDIVLLSHVAPIQSVAVYKVGKTLAGLCGLFFLPVWNAVRPYWMSLYYKGTGVSLFRKTIGVSLALALVALFSVVIIASWGDFVVPFLFGEEYAASVSILLVLIFGQIAQHAVTGWCRQWIISQGVFAMRNIFLVLTLTVISLIILVFRFSSPVAIAVTYISAQGLWAFIWWVDFTKTTLARGARLIPIAAYGSSKLGIL